MAAMIKRQTMQFGQFKVVVEVAQDEQQRMDGGGYYKEKTVVPVRIETIAQADPDGKHHTLNKEDEYVAVGPLQAQIRELEAQLLKANQNVLRWKRQAMGLEDKPDETAEGVDEK